MQSDCCASAPWSAECCSADLSSEALEKACLRGALQDINADVKQLTVRKAVVLSLPLTGWFIGVPYSYPNCGMLERCHCITVYSSQSGFVVETATIGAQHHTVWQGAPC